MTNQRCYVFQGAYVFILTRHILGSTIHFSANGLVCYIVPLYYMLFTMDTLLCI